MKYLIYLLFIVFPLGQLARLSLPQTEITLHLNDFVVALTIIIWLAKSLSSKAKLKEISKDRLFKPLLFFVAVMAFSLAINSPRLNSHQLLVASLYALRFIAYSALYFLFKDQSEKTKSEIPSLFKKVILLVALVGILQYLLLPDVSFLKAFDWDDHYYRLISTFLDPGFTGAILVLGLTITYLSKLAKKTDRLIFLIIYIAMALTYSRASYLMYLVSFATIAYFKKSLKVILLATILLAFTIFLLPRPFGEGAKLSRENSIWARIHNWQQSIQIWQQHPIFGIGYDSYRYAVGASSQSHAGAGADSSLLLILATTGIVGLLAYLNLLQTMWQVGRGNLLFKAGFFGLIAHSFFNNTLLYPWAMEWLWIFLALTG